MHAGFSKVDITPPLGTRMMGVGDRDMAHGCTAIHDPIFARALWVEHEGQTTLVVCYDFCFIGRALSDRFKGALGRVLDLLPRNIMLTTTHSHAGPAAGVWHSAGDEKPDRLYEQALEDATLKAALHAKADAKQATISAGMGRSSLPLNRRLLINGRAENVPNPNGPTCDALPVCLFKDQDDKPICCVFSIAVHPSIVRGWEISAEFPGAACDLLDAHLGHECAMFLQGMGGDAKPRTIAKGDDWFWKASWPEMEETARVLAQETQSVLENGMQPVQPNVGSSLLEMRWPLDPIPSRESFEQVKNNTDWQDPFQIVKGHWAIKHLALIDHYQGPLKEVSILMQTMQWGQGLLLVAVEGEPMAYHANAVLDVFDGVTFPLGYANGEALYLTTTNMPSEGGMEVESYCNFGFPSPLAVGSESIFDQALRAAKAKHA